MKFFKRKKSNDINIAQLSRKTKFFHTVVIFCIICSFFRCQLKASDSVEEEISFIIKVCSETRVRSNQTPFYVVSLNPNFDLTPLIQNFHRNAIETMLMDYLKSSERYWGPAQSAKNILLIINDLSDVWNLILGSSAFNVNHTYKNFNTKAISSMVLHKNCTNGRHYESQLPKLKQRSPYCILYNDGPDIFLRDRIKDCDQTIRVSEIDLAHDRDLSGELFEHIEGLYLSNVWNPYNYLMFIIPNPNDETPAHCVFQSRLAHGFTQSCNKPNRTKHSRLQLLLTFRFMWRTFRGHKAVICFDSMCFWYDPFHEKIHKYTNEDTKSYFDFSWSSMREKGLSVYLLRDDIKLLEFLTGATSWSTLLYTSSVSMALKRNGYAGMRSFIEVKGLEPLDPKLCVKYAIDLYAVEGTMGMNSVDFPSFDFLPAIDNGVLFFMVPRRGFMPPYMTVSRCFTASVWILMLVSFTTVLMVHQTHKHLQIQKFSLLYTEKELMSHENLSTTLTTYRYFLSISHPRLFLGKLTSGKILFVVFIFSTIILATLLQSRMVTLLSRSVRFSDYDTLQELAASDLLVQTDTKIDSDFFSSQPQLEWLHERQTTSFKYVSEALNDAYHNFEYNPDLPFYSLTPDAERVSNESIDRSGKSLDAILRHDAFFTSGPARLMKDKNVMFDNIQTAKKYEYHYVREYVMSYPFMYPILKNSFYRDSLSDTIARLLESGILNEGIGTNSSYTSLPEEPSAGKDGSEDAKPLTLTDLQIAFISLAIGLFLSFTAFISELLFQF